MKEVLMHSTPLNIHFRKWNCRFRGGGEIAGYLEPAILKIFSNHIDLPKVISLIRFLLRPSFVTD